MHLLGIKFSDLNGDRLQCRRNVFKYREVLTPCTTYVFMQSATRVFSVGHILCINYLRKHTG